MVVLSTRDIDDAPAPGLDQAIAECLRDAGFKVVVVPHLYHVAEHSPLWGRIAGQRGAGPVVLLSWLHPRPAEWLLRHHGFDGDGLIVLDLGIFATAEACLAAVRQKMADAGASFESPTNGRIVRLDESITQRWYPVVDGSRCVHCQHCLQFCLFGVYALDEAGRLRVQNPDQCKPGCPACSRICPQGAIIFPLYARDEAIAGAPGRFMTPDLAARRMFYSRTHRPCPICGNTVQGQQPPAAVNGEPCPECGGPRAPSVAAVGSVPAAFDDLDALVDQLDQVMHRKR